MHDITPRRSEETENINMEGHRSLDYKHKTAAQSREEYLQIKSSSKNDDENTERRIDIHLPLIKGASSSNATISKEMKPRFTFSFRKGELPSRVHEKITREIVIIDRKLREDMFLQKIRTQQRIAYNKLSRAEKLVRLEEGTVPHCKELWEKNSTPLKKSSRFSSFEAVRKYKEQLSTDPREDDQETAFASGIDFETFSTQRQCVRKKMETFERSARLYTLKSKLH